MGKKQLLVLLSAISTVIACVILFNALVEQRHRQSLADSLQTILDGIDHGVKVWADDNRRVVKNIVDHELVLSATNELLDGAWSKEALLENSAQEQLRNHLESSLKNLQYGGFIIIGPNNINLAASLDAEVGGASLLTKQPDVLSRLWSGETVFSQIESPDEIPGQSNPDSPHPNMFIGTPIRNELGKVIALLTLRIDPYDTLFPLMMHGRLGSTGETYLFNREGLMLNDSRFVEQLFEIGMLEKRDGDHMVSSDHASHSHLKITLRDPGEDLTLRKGMPPDMKARPLTRMAVSAIRGESGIDLDGYRDYRGLPVVGVWLWEKSLDIGITTEQDVVEAYALFYFTRNVIVGGGFLTILILLLLSYQYSKGRQQLKMSQDRLSAVLSNVIDSILVIDSRGVIKEVNPVTEKIFGYSKKELVGHNVSVLMPEPYASQHDDYLKNYLQTGESIIIDNGREVEARHANGDHFPIDLGVSRLELDDGLHFVGVIRDISERKAALQKLEDERTFTREVLDSLNSHIAVLDENGTIILTNAAWDSFAADSGVSLSTVGVGVNYLEVCEQAIGSDSDVASKVVAKMRKMLTGEEKNLYMEYPCNTPSEQRWFQMRASRFLHANSPAVVVSHQDITQRVLFENELRITSLVAENTDNAVIVTDLEGRIEWVNQGFIELSGYERKEVVGHKPGSLLQGPETDAATVQNIREAFRARRKIEGEILNYRKDGEPYWIQFEISPVFDNEANVIQFVALEQDITEQKRMVDELRWEKDAVDAANNLLSITREALSHSGISEMWLRAKDGSVVRVNEQACKHLNYSREKLLSLNLPDFDPNYTMEHYHEAVRSIQHEGWKRFESIHQTSDGRRVPVEITSLYQPDYADHGDILINFISDITQRKEAEIHLIQAQKEAEDANHAKSTFLATMSHEIRTPLNGVVGTIEMLEYSNLDSSQRDLVTTAGDSAKLLQVIIDDILDFSKIEAGHLELEQLPINVEALVEKTGVNLQPIVKKQDVELLIYIDPTIPGFKGDPVRLKQILYNLAGNAVKFSGNQKDKKGRVVISVQLEGQQDGRVAICLKVSDNGIGMNPDIQSRLFQPFVQGEVETTRHFGGTGLGLVITKRLVEIMGGSIEVESAEGIGSTFSVHLSFEQDANSPVTESSDIKGVKVILIDSNSNATWILENYLKYAEAEVTITQPDEAVETCRKVLTRGDESVVLIDAHNTPEMTEPLCEKLRSELKELDLRFVFVERGQRRNARISEGNCIVIDLDILHRSVLLNSVAAAVGRESHKQILPVASGIELNELLVDGADVKSKCRLLLADDNETNRNVIGQQLRLLGYSVEFAVDGREALEMWREGDYALLLTDCHMPEMDGYQLAKEIRKEEQEEEHKPILAITADAMKGTSQKCLAAGMDDYLTKPIQLPQLQSALASWLPVTGEVENKSDKQKQVDINSDAAIDHMALGNLLGTQERAMLADYYKEFLETSTPTFKGIEEAFKREDMTKVATLVHKMKSPAKTLGANALADCCLTLEMAIKSGDIQTVNEKMPLFANLFWQFTNWIEQYLEQDD
jgi:PAS domain S-box-containing protein